MERPSASTRTGVHTDQSSISGTRLHRRWLVLVRRGGLALIVLTMGLFFAAMPLYFAYLRNGLGQPTPDALQRLQALGLSLDFFAAYHVTVVILFALVYFLVGVVIFWRKSTKRIALLATSFLVTFPFAYIANDISPALPPILQVPFLCVSFLGSVSIFLFPYVFPDGHFVPRWTRWMVLVAIVNSVFITFSPPSTPFLIQGLVTVAFFTLLGLAIVVQIYRYRRVSSLVERQQTKWVVYGLSTQLTGLLGLLLVMIIFPSLFPDGSLVSLMSFAALACIQLLIPLSVGFAILYSRLWDIDRIINRTLVYGVLTVSIVALYVLVVVGLGTILQAQGNLGIALLATGLVAVLFHPLRDRLQRAVNRLMYGDRDEPYHVISRLGQRLEATLAPEAVLPTIVETVAQAFKLPYAAITVSEEETLTPAASFGASREGEEFVRLPLVAHQEQVGALVLAPRAPGEAFTPADQRLLEDLSRQIGVAVYAVRLTADLKRLTLDLQHARERLVTAREEERRRLRRDLHDGLGPQLASLMLKLETARNRLAHDPLAQTMLSDLAERTQVTVADIRRLVYALRPPALDELGLLSALRELTLLSSDQVVMHLDAPDCLPELPAAVEVAVYRITQEALTNVVRHAHAHHCDILLALDETAGRLSLSIQDDGCGLPPSRGVGVGLFSMRERAEELGGIWTIEQVSSGGTRVLARLPYVRSQTVDALVVTPNMVPQEEE